MKKFLITLTLLFPLVLVGQNKLFKTAKEIELEGKKLYRLEMAAWHGTDLLREQHPELLKAGGGYISYQLNNFYHFVFYDRNASPNTLADVAFDQSFDLKKATIDLKKRPLLDFEIDLYKARSAVSNYIVQDSTFKQYNNTALNLIPTPTKKGMKVYVLTGPKVNGVVVFGNDYEVYLNKKGKVKTVVKIHSNIIPLEYDNSKEVKTSFHTHLKSTGEFITPTDICTLLLYGKYTGWTHHMVTSEKYVSSWDIKNQQLIILTKEAWERIYKPKE